MQYLTVIISLAAIAISVSNISHIKKRDKEMDTYYKNRKNKLMNHGRAYSRPFSFVRCLAVDAINKA